MTKKCREPLSEKIFKVEEDGTQKGCAALFHVYM